MKKKYHKFSGLLIGIFLLNCAFTSVLMFPPKFQNNNPSKVSLLYDNYILVQLDSDSELRLDLIISQAIPGYDLYILILVSLQILAISIVIIRKRLRD